MKILSKLVWVWPLFCPKCFVDSLVALQLFRILHTIFVSSGFALRVAAVAFVPLASCITVSMLSLATLSRANPLPSDGAGLVAPAPVPQVATPQVLYVPPVAPSAQAVLPSSQVVFVMPSSPAPVPQVAPPQVLYMPPAVAPAQAVAPATQVAGTTVASSALPVSSQVQSGNATAHAPRQNSAYLRLGGGVAYVNTRGGPYNESMVAGLIDSGIGVNTYKNNLFYGAGVGFSAFLGEKSLYGKGSTSTGFLIDISNRIGYYKDVGSSRVSLYGMFGGALYVDNTLLSPFGSYVAGGLLVGVGASWRLDRAPIAIYLEFTVPILFSRASSTGSIFGYQFSYSDSQLMVMPRVALGLQIGF